jgi:hypothetical protein
MSESPGEGGAEEVGVIEKPAAKGGDILRSSGGGVMNSCLARSLRAVPLLCGSMGVPGPDTHGTTLVTTFERKDLEEAFTRDWEEAEVVEEDNAAADASTLRL